MWVLLLFSLRIYIDPVYISLYKNFFTICVHFIGREKFILRAMQWRRRLALAYVETKDGYAPAIRKASSTERKAKKNL